MSAASVFSADEEGVLFDLDCWENFSDAAERVQEHAPETRQGEGGDDREAEERNVDEGEEGNNRRRGVGGGGDDEERAEEEARGETHRRTMLERETRLKTAEAMLMWLRSIESRLVEKCAEVCDAAWYDLGETITYKGRSVAYSIPATVMEAATKRRESQDDIQRGKSSRHR